MKLFLKQKSMALVIAFIMITGLVFPAQAVSAASGDTTVYITKTGKKYHADGCSSLKKSKISITLKDAVAKGYEPCSKCNPGSLDASSSTNTVTASVNTSVASNSTASTATESAEVEALKTYKGNTKEFNAYYYYENNADLQTAIGANGDALLKHYNEYGKKEGRIAIAAATTTTGSAKSSNKSGYGFDTYNIPEQQNTTETYVLNTNTLKVHHPTCNDVKKIKPENYSTSSESTQTLTSKGYSLCGHCFK